MAIIVATPRKGKLQFRRVWRKRAETNLKKSLETNPAGGEDAKPGGH